MLHIDVIWIVLGLFVLATLLSLITGGRIAIGRERDFFPPIIRIQNFWIWLGFVVVLAVGSGFAMFLILTSQSR